MTERINAKPSFGPRRNPPPLSFPNKQKNRPRLTNLTKQREEERPRMNLRLCSKAPQHIQKEISILFIAVVVLNSVYAPLWRTLVWAVCLLIWFEVLAKDMSAEWVLTYARNLSILMAIFTHDDAWSYKLVSFANVILFYTAERILGATLKELDHQIKAHQRATEDLMKDYTGRSDLSVSVASEDIRDAFSMIMATLEQFAPPSILSNTYELLSACSMAVPITTISAINTVAKQAYHVGSRLKPLSDQMRQHVRPEKTVESTVNQLFDVGELVQNISDALAGLSAKLDIHFVVYHMDNGLHYTNIVGDEDATRHALVHLLKNVFEGCTPGACIELGLNVVSISDSPKLQVIFDIIQTASPAIPAGLSSSLPLIPNPNLTEQLIRYIGGRLMIHDADPSKVHIQVVLDAFPGKIGDQRLLFIEKPSQILEKQLENVRFSNEPTLEDLTSFISNLKGVRLVLHAPEKSVFAKHLTSSLTHWNVDISHVPLTASYDGLMSQMPMNNKIPSPAIEEDHIHSIPPAFVLIDDDVMILENKLREFHERRPRKAKWPNENILHQGMTIAVIYFTSLSNYKRVRDTIQWFSSLSSSTYPRVVVVPKPAGPRRFLTALHTAWINAVVEPQFIPIATSPLSPFVAKSPVSDVSSSFVTPSLFTPHERFSPGKRLQSPEDRGHYFTPKITSPLGVKETRRHRSHSNAIKSPEPLPKVDEIKTKFKMNFNISNRKRKEKNVSSQTSPPITVLIVEDNIINQAILSTWMKKHGIKFSVASDGKEAVEKWRGGGFHLILMDIQLPVMDGIQATKMIRGIEKEEKIGVLPSMHSEFQSPVIIVALTASSLESDRQAALAAGCNDFLTKPVSLEWLDKKITEWGCMQALIDFEGWKKWRKNKKVEVKDERQIKVLEERTRVLLKDVSRAIVLPGQGKSHTLIDSIPKQLEARDKNINS